VLQNLLRENVSILNLPLVLEGIGDFASISKNPDDLSELVRRRLGIYFVPELEARAGVVRAATLDPRLEHFLVSKVHRSASEIGLALDPHTAHHILTELSQKTAELVQNSLPPVVVVGAEIRLPLKRFIEPSMPRLTVLSFQELPSACEVENVGIVSCPANLLRAPEGKAA